MESEKKEIVQNQESSEAALSIQLAIDSHKSGNLKKAEIGYKYFLKKNPTNPEILYLLGALILQQNRKEEAIEILKKCISNKPLHFEALNALGVALSETEEHDEAMNYLKKARRINPNSPKILFNLGKTYIACKKYSQGKQTLKKYLQIKSDDIDGINNYSICLFKTTKKDQAIKLLLKTIEEDRANLDTYNILLPELISNKDYISSLQHSETAISKWPDDNKVYLSYAITQQKLRNNKEAKEAYEELISREKTNFSYHNKYANFLYETGKWREAEKLATKAYNISSDSVTAITNLGRIRQQRGDLESAKALYLKAIKLNPEYADAQNNLGNLLMYMDDVKGAIKYFDKAVELKPNNPGIKFNRSIAHLTLGNISDHWRDHRLRFTKSDPVEERKWPWPIWNGENLKNKKILLWGEQGLGDEIIHSRCIPDISKQSQSCAYETSPRLAKLFSRSFPEVKVFSINKKSDNIIKEEPFDFHSSIIDINCSRIKKLEEIKPLTYLKADPEKTETFRKRYLSISDNRPLIGISWSSFNTFNAHFKSTTLNMWDSIFENSQFGFVNLQYGDTSLEREELKNKNITNLINDESVDHMGDLDQVAAQISAMDLVITISNTTAHMAGALGVPVWNMLPTGPGRLWYWFLKGRKCPWYKSMKLFRHKYNEGWSETIKEITEQLNKNPNF